MKQLVADLAVGYAKVWTPSALFVGTISLTDVKEAALIMGAVVTMVCTILVTRSTIKKNK